MYYLSGKYFRVAKLEIHFTKSLLLGYINVKCTHLVLGFKLLTMYGAKFPFKSKH